LQRAIHPDEGGSGVGEWEWAPMCGADGSRLALAWQGPQYLHGQK
jgi:hypothetical protein